MRLLPKAIPVLIAIIAFDLAMVFGFAAHRILTSPVYGLDQPAFANLVYGIGGLFALKAQGLYSLAAFFGAVYLTVAAVLGLHIASRIGALRGGRVSHDLLDAGLILVVISTILAATPAILQGASDILIQERLPLWLVGLAATLSMIERLPETEARGPGFFERLWTRLVARFRRRESGVVSPVVRDRMAPERWNSLRGDAGMAVEAAPADRPPGPWFTLRTR
jgi:hypothetical protein